jgi:hypothetical protein
MEHTAPPCSGSRDQPQITSTSCRSTETRETGYDIKVSGNPHLLAESAAAGATWWGQWIPPGHPDDTHKTIATGPPNLS